MNFKVSVIIPTYGRPDNLKRAIDSVIEQTYKNIEIIVIDDNGINSK
ncbi:glycosyltransferase family 2 protein, partial [Escherichia coli]|nr:glycosyltransferase family 2 protein [Escherichia coli]